MRLEAGGVWTDVVFEVFGAGDIELVDTHFVART